MCKRFVAYGLAILGAVAFIGTAQAADMPIKAAPYAPAPPVWSWTGFYIGAHGGAGWGTESATLDVGSLGIGGVTGTFPIGQTSTSGFLGGGQIGYNWQWNSIVLGIEGDFSGADISGSSACAIGLLNCKATTNWVGDITGRLGFAHDRMLVYLKGGWAWANTDYDANLALAGLSISGSASDTHSGGLLGAGIEYAFLPHWTAKIEYNYIDLGSDTFAFPVTASAGGAAITVTPNISVEEKINIMKFGVNYKF